MASTTRTTTKAPKLNKTQRTALGLIGDAKAKRTARNTLRAGIKGFDAMGPGQKAIALKRAMGMDLTSVAQAAIATKGDDGIKAAAAKAVATREANKKPARKPRTRKAAAPKA